MWRVAALALFLAGPAAADDGVFGRWLVEDGRAVIELEPCGSRACGRLVWMQNPREADGSPKRDVNNPDVSERMRPLCGIRLVTGLEPAGGGAWKGGKIYSARDGRTYGFEVQPDGPGRLAARGFVGISLLGKSQAWVRDDGGRGNCTSLGAAGSDR